MRITYFKNFFLTLITVVFLSTLNANAVTNVYVYDDFNPNTSPLSDSEYILQNDIIVPAGSNPLFVDTPNSIVQIGSSAGNTFTIDADLMDQNYYLFNVEFYGPNPPKLTLNNLIIKNSPGIFNDDFLNVNNVQFLNNRTVLNGDVFGGAINNNVATIGTFNKPFTGIVNSLFSGNYLISSTGTASGGAIYNNNGTLSITDTDFLNNSAQFGGAITNWNSDLFIYAINKNVAFSGNSASVEADDIYTRGTSVIYLSAADGRNISFQGTISGSTTSPKLIAINPNDANGNSYTGTILFNNTVKNQRIELHNGLLQLGAINNPTPANGYLNNVVLDLSKASSDTNLSTYRGVVDGNGSAGTVSVIAGANPVGLYLDADMNSGLSDSFILNGNSAGLFTLKDVNITADSLGEKIFEIFMNPSSYTNNIDIGGNLTVFTNTSKYIVEGLGLTNPGAIKIKFDGAVTSNPLNQALNSGADAFSFTDNLIQDVSISRIQSSTGEFILNGNNNYSLIADSQAVNSIEGFTLTANQKLTVLNLSIKDFNSKDGSVIDNSDGGFLITNTSFENNGGVSSTITNLGGAILNKSDNTSDIYHSTFEGNHSKSNGSLTGISGGGAIYSVGSSAGGILNISDTKFDSNTAVALDGDSSVALGGAILNGAGSTLNVSGSSFNDNIVHASAIHHTAIAGGAIYNMAGGTVNVNQTAFIGNKTTHEGTLVSDLSLGGAIANGDIVTDLGGTVNISNSYFENNSVGENGAISYGGAIFNANDMTISDSSFVGNSVIGDSTQRIGGGAIYNEGDLRINATNSDVVFLNNTVNGNPNDIEHFKGTLTLHADKNIILNGGISGNSQTNPNIIKEGNGALVLNGGDNSFSGLLELTEGSINLGQNGTFFDSLLVLKTTDGTLLDFANNNIQNQILGSTYSPTSGITKMAVDVDAKNLSMDTITSQTLDSLATGGISVDSINILSQTSLPELTLNFANDILKNIVSTTVKTVDISPVYKYYNVNYNQNSGDFTFSAPKNSGYHGVKPSIMSGAVATQIGGYLNQVDLYRQAFANMDMMMVMPKSKRMALKFANKYAAASENLQTFSPLNEPLADNGLWMRPFSTFENVPLKNGPTVSNVAYGTLVGGDSKLYQLKHGFDGMYNVFGAYTGSHQTYDGVSIYQNGGYLGATGVLYKGNFFTGLTADVGANAGEASSSLGRDNFTMIATGVASKTGYNWELFNEKFIIQPSYLMSYTFVNTFDYNTSNGVNIQTKPLNAIQIEPGIKFIGNLKNGWQPYLGVSMIWNIIDKADFKANDVSLPELSVKPYIRYGAGVQRTWGERFSGFGQFFITNGGRNGIGLQFGFRWRV